MKGDGISYSSEGTRPLLGALTVYLVKTEKEEHMDTGTRRWVKSVKSR